MVPEPNPIPGADQLTIKPPFAERYRQLLGDEGYDRFMAYSRAYLRKSIRVNTLKIETNALLGRLESDWALTPIPWCPDGFWIEYRHEDRFDIGNLREHQLGYLYLQESVSMLPPLALEPKPGENILDLCAAPGSKTSQIAAMMANEGLLIANDTQWLRLKPLGLNLQRCGVRNVIITYQRGQRFGSLGPRFDGILCDAPCSGTGTIRKSLKTLRTWSPNVVRKLAAEQRQLLDASYRALKPGGVLVYSTCTLEPEENEANVSWLLRRYGDLTTEAIDLPIIRGDPITQFNGDEYDLRVNRCLRIWPQLNDTEGFFVAKMRKRS